MSTKQLRKRRENLMKIDPTCWYCGIRLYYEYSPVTIRRPDFATIEHLFSRRNNMRSVPSKKAATVLACLECNESRGRYTTALIGCYC